MGRRIVLGFAALAAMGASSSLAQQSGLPPRVAPMIEIYDARAAQVEFGCEAPRANFCQFHVESVTHHFAQRFALEGGQRVLVTGVIPDVDAYAVTINQPAPFVPDCSTIGDTTGYCRVAVVRAGYNGQGR